MAPRFECEHCLKIFKSKESRHHHLAKCHGYEPIIYKCEKCPKTFKYKDKLIVHMSESHQQTNMRYECGQCTSSFKNYHHLRQHVMFVHDPNKKPYECKECSKIFERRDAYAQHVRYVHSQTVTLHRCELCNRIYKGKATLQKHISVNHNENFKRSACPLCPSDFKWPHHLKQHINKVHIQVNMPSNSKVQTNRCTLCLLMFNEKLEMLIHMRSVHNLDVDIYKCCQCPAVFNLKDPFIRHLEMHEEIKGEHKCDQCYPILNPKLYIENNEQIQDYGLRPEDEVVDFEVAVMEDPELRQLLRYKMRHSEKTGLYVHPDSNCESDDENINENGMVTPSEPIVELTIGANINDNSGFEQNNMIMCEEDKSIEDKVREIPIEYNNSSPVSEINTEHILQKQLSNSVSKKLPLSGIEITNENESIDPKENICQFDISESSIQSINQTKKCIETEEIDVPNSKSFTDTKLKCKRSKRRVPFNNSSKKLIVNLQRIDVKDKSKGAVENKLQGITKTYKKIFKCKFCLETFKKPVEVARHVKLHHSKIKMSQIRTSKCKYCFVSFDNCHNLTSHIKMVHTNLIKKTCFESTANTKFENNNNDNSDLESITTDNHNEVSDISSPEQSPTTAHECGKCELSFHSKLELLRHISSAHLNIRNIKSLKYKHNKSSNRALFNCIFCENTFSDKISLEEHVKKIHSKKSYPCATCNLNFNNEVDLTQHMKMQHRHKCGICSIAFVHKEKLFFHLENEHKGRPKEHKCDICNVTFKLASSLVKHLDEKHKDKNTKEPQIVTKDMEKVMHKCVHCGALFPLRESLRRHIQLEHDTGSVHKCGECTAVFNDVDEFKEHLQIEHMQNNTSVLSECL